jgi:preprotein translocase subunit SecG
VEKIVVALFAVLCAVIIAIILMQHRKSGGFAGSFGGGGTQMDMSGGSWQRMSTLTKITVGLIALFMLLSLVMVKMKL